MAFGEHNHEVLFLNLLLLRTPRRHKPSSERHRNYIPQAQQNTVQSALHRAEKYIQQYVRLDQNATTQASRHERASRVLPRAMYEYFMFLFSSMLFALCFTELMLNTSAAAVSSLIKPTTINLEFFQVTLTLSPVTGRRLDYTISSLDIGVTDVTKNSRLSAVTAITCSTLLLAVCSTLFFHTSSRCEQPVSRFVILATKAL